MRQIKKMREEERKGDEKEIMGRKGKRRKEWIEKVMRWSKERRGR